MVEAANVRKQFTVKVDRERGQTNWNPDQLCDVFTDRDGYLPNPGDTIMFKQDDVVVTETVIDVDYEACTWVTTVLPGDEDIPLDANLEQELPDAGQMARTRMLAKQAAIRTGNASLASPPSA